MLEHYPGMGRKLVEDGRWELFELERALDGSRKELGGWGETRAVRSVPQGFVLQCFLYHLGLEHYLALKELRNAPFYIPATFPAQKHSPTLCVHPHDDRGGSRFRRVPGEGGRRLVVERNRGRAMRVMRKVKGGG